MTCRQVPGLPRYRRCPVSRQRPDDCAIDAVDALFAEDEIAPLRSHGHLPSDGRGPRAEYERGQRGGQPAVDAGPPERAKE